MSREKLYRKEVYRLRDEYGYAFPTDFLEFVSESSPCEIDYSDPPLLFQVYDIENIIQANTELNMSELLPNFFMFGVDGGNEMLTFKLDEPNKWAVFMTPMIVMSEKDSVLLANSFKEFLERSNAISHN